MQSTRKPSREARKSLLSEETSERSFQPYPGGYYDREGYASKSTGPSYHQSKMYIPNSKWTWAFLLITAVQAAIVLAFESYVFGKFQSSLENGALHTPEARTIPTYLTLFIFGLLYQIGLVWDALRLKNTIQIIGLCIYNLGLLIYAAVQKDQIRVAVQDLHNTGKLDPQADIWRAVKPYMVAVPCVLALGTVLLSFVAWKLYGEFAWSIYKHISADLRMKRRFLTFQIYIALLKFDFFFFLGFTVQFVVIVVNLNIRTAEFALTIAAIPITIVILIMAGWITRRENRPGMAFVILLYFAALAYFIFKLVRIYQPPSKSKYDYSSARRSLTTFAVIAVILIVLTIINAFCCLANFGKGLKRHIVRRKVSDPDEKPVVEMPNLPHGQMPARMTID